jgi:hypothetical protein
MLVLSVPLGDTLFQFPNSIYVFVGHRTAHCSRAGKVSGEWFLLALQRAILATILSLIEATLKPSQKEGADGRVFSWTKSGASVPAGGSGFQDLLQSICPLLWQY